MKEAFRENLHLSDANIDKLDTINEIIEEYRKQGYRLTLRQLYYQLVSRDLIANKVTEYTKLGTLLVKGRMAGVVDWDAIEDRIRVPYLQYWVKDVEHAINDTINQYKLDRMQGQEVYIELWVEKDALSGVLKRVTNEYHVRLMVNRGYSSCTAMHDAYERIYDAIDEGRQVLILYLGDHDPSGLDMVRDIKDRIKEFLQSKFDDEDIETMFKVEQIGLTKEQIKQYNPPPNPAKITDPRAKWYIREYGQVSWEVDALRPQVLNQIVVDAIEDNIDFEKFNNIKSKEDEDKEKLKEIMDKFKDGDE